MERLQGVAAKYLDNYLFWFRFLERYKELTGTCQNEQMISRLSTYERSNRLLEATPVRRWEGENVKVQMVDYNENWIIDFEQEADKLKEAHNCSGSYM